MPDSTNEIDLYEIISRSARRFRRAGLAIEQDSIQVFSNEDFLASYEEEDDAESAESVIIIEETNLSSSSDSQPIIPEGAHTSNSDNTSDINDDLIVPEIFTSTQPMTTSTSTSKIVIIEIPVDYSDPASEILESEYDFRYEEDIEDIELIDDIKEIEAETEAKTEVEIEGDSDAEASPSDDTEDEIVIEIDEDFEDDIEDINPDIFSETEEIIF
jgi:hypothetical protein